MKKLTRKGFTLVELMLVLAVTTILFGAIVTIFVQSIDMYVMDQSKAQIQTSVNVAAVKTDSLVRKATNVYMDTDGCHIVHAAGTDILSLNTTTHVLSLNGSTLTTDIAEFSCSTTGSTVTIHIKSVNDHNGSSVTFDTTITLRKGD